jgi:HTH-type transcriptional regulator, sugar sensing transcriptional regulator
MSIQDQLKELSLTKSEIKIYLYLLEMGISTPPQIAKGTGIARTNCYNILSSLKDQGLINEQEKGNRKVYLASDPESLLRRVQKRKEVIEQLLPDLRALHTTQKNKPKIEFYDGFEQVKEIYLRATNTKKLMAIGSVKAFADRDTKFFLDFEKKLKSNGTHFQDLVTDTSSQIGIKETKKILKGLYDFRTLSNKYADSPTDILIWDNHIALITLEDPVFGTVITSELLARMFSYMFEMLWESRGKN